MVNEQEEEVKLKGQRKSRRQRHSTRNNNNNIFSRRTTNKKSREKTQEFTMQRLLSHFTSFPLLSLMLVLIMTVTFVWVSTTLSSSFLSLLVQDPLKDMTEKDGRGKSVASLAQRRTEVTSVTFVVPVTASILRLILAKKKENTREGIQRLGMTTLACYSRFHTVSLFPFFDFCIGCYVFSYVSSYVSSNLHFSFTKSTSLSKSYISLGFKHSFLPHSMNLFSFCVWERESERFCSCRERNVRLLLKQEP